MGAQAHLPVAESLEELENYYRPESYERTLYESIG